MIQLTLQERISQFLRCKNKLWKSCWYSQEQVQQRTGSRLSTFTHHGDFRWWKKSWKRFSENRRLVVSTEIDSPLDNFRISVEVEKFPRASSSSARRPRQVAADRARAGENFLIAHFPASPSMSRLAGSSGTQKVCEATESRNRTGGRRWNKSRARHPPTHAATSLHGLTVPGGQSVRMTKSRRSGQSQTPEAMTQ